MSQYTFINLAVERLLNNEPAVVSYEQAMKQYEEAETARLFDENRALLELLEGSAEVVETVHTKTQKVTVTEPKTPYAVDTILNAEVKDGPASRILDPNELEWEEV